MIIDKNNDDYCYYIARKNIKKYRHKLGITAQELADKCDFTHQFIRSLESLKIIKRPRLDSLYRISRALGIELKDLFDESDK